MITNAAPHFAFVWQYERNQMTQCKCNSSTYLNKPDVAAAVVVRQDDITSKVKVYKRKFVGSDIFFLIKSYYCCLHAGVLFFTLEEGVLVSFAKEYPQTLIRATSGGDTTECHPIQQSWCKCGKCFLKMTLIIEFAVTIKQKS